MDAFPICLDTTDPDEIVAAVKAIAPAFGGINLEDISSPRCFEVEERLKEELDIPVFHDDQHGTAVVVMAALFNALKLTGKRIEDLQVGMVGLGAAGIAVTRMLLRSGVGEIIGCDTHGLIHTERDDWDEMHPLKRWYAENTNFDKRSGGPEDVLEGVDLFIGLSGARVIRAEALRAMNDDAMVFAMANPEPEVMPEDAAPYVRMIATGRSDYPNQINNVLCFPGVFRGALDARATQITEEMKLAAAHGIANVIPESELSEDYIIPSVFNRDVADAVASAVAEEARRVRRRPRSSDTGVPRRSAAQLARLAAPAQRLDERQPSVAHAIARDLVQARVAVVVERERPDHAVEVPRVEQPLHDLVALVRLVARAPDHVEQQRHRRVTVGGVGVGLLAELAAIVAQEALSRAAAAGWGR